jgi:hypothetical protein
MSAGAWLAVRGRARHQGLIFLASVAIVWLGLAIAHGPLPFG